MLHDAAFLEQLKHTQHCRQYAINGGKLDMNYIEA